MVESHEGELDSSTHLRKTKLRGFRTLIGLGVAVVSSAVLWLNLRAVLADVILRLLSGAQINATQSFSLGGPQLVVGLVDGSSLDITLTWQRSGLVSAVIFGLLFAFLMFPIEGSFWFKVFWLETGFLMGLTWSFLRLLASIFASYYFGAQAFALAEFFTGPPTDFFWVVSVWSLSLSTSASIRGRRTW